MRGRELRALRILRGLTVKDMGEALGKAPSSYSQKERGINSFQDDEKIIIAKVLGMTVQQFNDVFFDGKLELKAG